MPLSVQLADEKILFWNVALVIINPDSLYCGGYLKAKLSFPSNYPFSPPGKTLKHRNILITSSELTQSRFPIHPPSLSS